VLPEVEMAKSYWDLTSIEQEKKLKDVAKEFEAYFFRVFLKEAEKTIPEGLFNSSFAAKFYLDMFSMQLSEVIAQKDPLHFDSFFEKAIKAYQSYGKEG
jgi:flagellar protein FlgJ